MRQHRALAATGLIAVALLVGCTSRIRIDNGVVGAGSLLTETREVGTAFDRIEVGGGIVLDVSVGPETSVELEAQENLLPILRTEVEEDTLTVRNTQNYAATRPVRLSVTVPVLVGVVLSGGSVGTADGLGADAFEVELTGGAELTAGGTVGELVLLASGGSKAHLDGLAVDAADVDLSGGCEAHLAGADRVTGKASGGSRVFASGGADVEVDASGGSEVVAP